MKHLDWNSAIIGDEDERALASSEVFGNYVKIAQNMEKEAINKKQKEVEKKNKAKFKKDTDNIMKKVYKAEDDSDVPAPWVRNLDYDGDDYQEHKRRVDKANKAGKSPYKEMIGDYKVYHKKSDAEIHNIMKAAMEEVGMEVIEEAYIDDEGMEDFEGEEVEKLDRGYDYESLYNTGAGESEYIEIGVTSDTEDLMDRGIDYIETDLDKEEVPEEYDEVGEIEVEEVEEDVTEGILKDIEEEELKEAEASLGLNRNVYYILSKMGK